MSADWEGKWKKRRRTLQWSKEKRILLFFFSKSKFCFSFLKNKKRRGERKESIVGRACHDYRPHKFTMHLVASEQIEEAWPLASPLGFHGRHSRYRLDCWADWKSMRNCLRTRHKAIPHTRPDLKMAKQPKESKRKAHKIQILSIFKIKCHVLNEMISTPVCVATYIYHLICLYSVRPIPFWVVFLIFRLFSSYFREALYNNYYIVDESTVRRCCSFLSGILFCYFSKPTF